ncbi:MAG: sodium/solute symporter, partial [Planctomycetota bacterium]
YFVGGGNMNSVLVGVSLFATLLSTISYLSLPGEVLGKGPVYMTNLLALPFVFVVVGYVLLPVYMRYRVTSAYELLETRLGLSVRMLGVVMFLSLRLVWMSLLVYLTAKALTVMIGVGESWIPAIVLATGLVSVTYASMGGMRAVVITDLMQTILLFSGAVLVLVVVTIDFGGFGWFPTEWQDNWDTQPLFSLDPSTRVTFFGAVLTVFVWQVCTAGGDQVSVQRFMSTKDAAAARRSFAVQMILSTVVQLTLCLVGLALLGFFQAHPESLPDHLDLKANADKIFPRFIAFHLPVGVSGLVVSAMFAAAMSSIDSGVNSITAVVMTDLLDRFGKKPETEREHVFIARLLAFGIGVTIVVGSLFVGQIPGNITEVTNRTVNLMVPMIFSLFFFALFVPFSTPVAVWIGWACGTATAVLVAFSGQIFGVDPVTELPPVSFQWIGPASLAVNLFVGIVVSLVIPSAHSSQTANSE